MIGSKVTEIQMIKKIVFCIHFFYVFLLSFRKVKNQINSLQQDRLGTRNERTLVSKISMLAQKWSDIAVQKEMIFWSSQIIIDGSRSATASCCAYWGS